MSTRELMGAVPDTDPLMVAWKAYRESAEYANTAKWAVKAEHSEGSLWAAFEQGFRAARRLEGLK